MFSSKRSLFAGASFLMVALLATTASAQDADGDGLSDADETNVHMTNPASVDTDGDGLTDSDELTRTNTSPIAADSDNGGVSDYIEILLGTDPNDPTDDDGTLVPQGTGAAATWVVSAATMNSIATAQTRFMSRTATNTRHFISPTTINYSDQALPGPHTPYANHARAQDVWGNDPDFFVSYFYGLLYVPPATMSNAENIYTFAASTDDGFLFRISNGAGVQSQQFDANRGMGTGPLLTVDFPNEGGLFPFEYGTWEQGGLFGIALSWAPGAQASFNTTTFKLVPHESFASPEIASTQIAQDVNGGVVLPGDVIEYTVTLTNTGMASAYNVVFEPRTLLNQTFDGYTSLPATGQVDAMDPLLARVSILNPGQSVSLRYRTTLSALGMTFSAQGHIGADSSAISPIGQGRIRALTDDPRLSDLSDTGNRPAAYDPNGASDDDPTAFALNDDLTPPVVALSSPPNGSSTSDDTPTISGTSEAGADIEVTLTDINGVVVQTLTASTDALGQWSVDAASLPDGDYLVRATAMDAAGNISAPAGPNAFTVDTIDPSISIDDPADNALLNDATPTISGTTEPGAVVTVSFINDALVTVQTGVAMVDGAGQWVYTATGLPDGVYLVEAVATDAAGNQSSDVIAIQIDTVAPAILLATPVDGSSSNDDTPTITGITDDNVAVTVVIRDQNGVVVQTLNTTSDALGDFSVDAASLNDGAYTVTATATDEAGNTSAPAGPNAFTVDTVGPAVAIVTPADGAQTNDTTPTISGTTEPGATLTIELVNDMGVVVQTISPMVGVTGAFSFDAQTLADGPYTIRATSADALGNMANATSSFIVDTVSPAVTLDAPINGTRTQDTTPQLLGTGEPGATVAVSVVDGNGVVVFSDVVTVDLTGQWSAQLTTPLADGGYQAAAVATDAAGNTANAGPNAFTVDTTAPALTITSPADGATVANRRPTITGVTEAGLSVTVVVRDAQNMVVLTQTVSADAQGGYSVQPSADLADGSYSVEASTADAAGNSASATSSFNVNATALPVDLVTPADNALLSANQPTISGTTAPSTMVSLTVRDAQNLVVAQLNVTSDAQGDFSVALPMALADGAYTIEASVSNGAGVTSTDSSSFIVDTTAPAVSLISPASGASTNDTTPTISGAADPGAQLSISITDANGAVVQTLTATADAQGLWSVDATPLAEGSYQVAAVATDAAGNTANAGPNSFTVDTTAPALTVDTPVDGSVLGTRAVDVAGTGEPGASVEVELVDAQGVVLGTQQATVDQGGVWQVSFMGLANGDYTANASSTDAAGNSATATTGFSVDSQAPNLSVTTPAQDEVTSDDTPTISGTTDVGNVITVEILDDQGMVIQTYTPAVDQGGAWSVDATQLPEGDYQVKATASGQNGLDSEVVVDFSVDLTAPGVTLSEPADGLISAMNTLTATGTSDAGQEVIVSVKDAQGQEVFSGNVTADANGAWSLPLMMLNDGAYTVEASASDAAGNVATAGPNSFTIDTMAPTVTITSPAAGSTIEDATPTLTGTAEPGATVEILIDGVKVGEATADAQGSWSFDVVDALLPGSHTVEAKTTDEAGNEGSSGEVTFTLETPTTPVVITSPTEGGTVTGPSVTVTGTGEPGQMVTVSVGGKSETVTVADDGSWTVTFDEVPAGETTITAQGDGSSTSITITVEEADVPAAQGGYLVAGGACSQTSKGAPLDLGLMVLFAGLGLALFRRRQ